MNKALEEVAAGYAGHSAYACGNRAVALPGRTGCGNSSFIIILVIIIAICACSGFGGSECCYGRKGRRVRFGTGGLLLLIFGLLLLSGNRGGNLNTNVINVNAQAADDGYDDGGFLDI